MAQVLYPATQATYNRNARLPTPIADISSPPLNAIGSVAHFGTNEMIFAEGDGANYIYKVLSGAVRLCKLLADGRRQITEFSLPGDHFGFEWGSEHTITAEALGPVVVLQCPKNGLNGSNVSGKTSVAR